MIVNDKCLSAFAWYEKKKQKYVNDVDWWIQPYKRSEYYDKLYCIVLTIVPILLTLTAELIKVRFFFIYQWLKALSINN